MISRSLLDSFYPVNESYGRVEKERKATNCCVAVRSLVMVRNQLPRGLVLFSCFTDEIFTYVIFVTLSKCKLHFQNYSYLIMSETKCNVVSRTKALNDEGF